MILITDIADAVVEALQSFSFSQEFTAERLYLPVFELKDMGVLHVTVGMRSIETVPATRGGMTEEIVKIDVAVQKKLDPSQFEDPGLNKIVENQEVDELMGLVREIIDFLKPIRAFAGARCYLIENSPVYLPDHMRTLRQFTSVITLSLKVIE